MSDLPEPTPVPSTLVVGSGGWGALGGAELPHRGRQSLEQRRSSAGTVACGQCESSEEEAREPIASLQWRPPDEPGGIMRSSLRPNKWVGSRTSSTALISARPSSLINAAI